MPNEWGDEFYGSELPIHMLLAIYAFPFWDRPFWLPAVKMCSKIARS